MYFLIQNNEVWIMTTVIDRRTSSVCTIC